MIMRTPTVPLHTCQECVKEGQEIVAEYEIVKGLSPTNPNRGKHGKQGPPVIVTKLYLCAEHAWIAEASGIYIVGAMRRILKNR